MKEFKEMLIDSMSPHVAASMRETNGSPCGCEICERCGANNAHRNRQRTAYVDSDNMMTLCPTCQDDADEYWASMWEDYYGGLL